MSTTGLKTSTSAAEIAASAADKATEQAAPVHGHSSSQARRHLQKLAAVVLLGGSVRATRLSQVIQRSVLDLPVDADCSLLDYWHAQTIRLARHLSLRRLQVRVMVDRDAIEPRTPSAHEHAIMSVERDPLEYRGTGGVLKDLSSGYADDDYLLVGNAAQLLIDPLVELAEALAECNADVCVIAHRDGTPSGLMLVKCVALRGIADEGFVDMKEQALPGIAQGRRVEVLERDTPSSVPVRNVSDYLSALRRRARASNGNSTAVDLSPYAEQWHPAFSIVEPGASLGSGARVHDSVVLKGATVEAGAVIVRSLLGPGAKVARGQMVVEQLLGPDNKKH